MSQIPPPADLPDDDVEPTEEESELEDELENEDVDLEDEDDDEDDDKDDTLEDDECGLVFLTPLQPNRSSWLCPTRLADESRLQDHDYDNYRLGGLGTRGVLLDIDLPCILLPSSTVGHFHLFIDKAIPRELYLKLMEVLCECGIVGEGNIQQLKSRDQTTIRKPGVKK